MKKIQNTQYLRKGTKTNFGIVTAIFDNKNFQTDNKFTWNLDCENVTKITSPPKSI